MTRRRIPGGLRLAGAIAGASIIAIVLLVLVIAVWCVRAALPKIDGRVEVQSVKGPVTIRRDERGIAHVAAGSEADLYFGNGYACAQDRLWEMDLLRREAQARLSEVVGSAALPLDRYYATLGLTEAAERDAASLRPREVADWGAFADGVNAYSQSQSPPLEFRLLGYQPPVWTIADSLSIVKLMEQRLDDEWKTTALRDALAKRLGESTMRALTSDSLPALEHYVPGYGAGVRRSGSARTGWRFSADPSRMLAFSSSDVTGADHVQDAGSNNWAIAGRRTTTGKPILSNDTHLSHSVPSTWWIVQLKGAGFDVEGFTIPGVPGVTLGHNERIAFGVTSAYGSAQDLFAEHFRARGSDEYRVGSTWVKAQHRVERIPVKGKPDEVVDVLVTEHGPIVRRNGTTGYALAWTALRDEDHATALRSLDLASNWTQFRAALSQLIGPNLNFGYADVDGHIGYQDAGRLPLRAGFDGWLPADGADRRQTWRGDIPFDRMPHALDPPDGVLATANNALTSAGFGPSLSTGLYAPPYRIDRIYSLLARKPKWTPEGAGAMQSDTFDYPDAQLARLTVQALSRSPDAALRLVATDLSSWDGHATADSRAATFLNAERATLVKLMFERRLGTEYAPFLAQFHPIAALERALSGDNSLAAIGVTHASIVAAIPQAAAQTASSLGVERGSGLDRLPAWGVKDAAIFEHPLGQVWPLDALLNFKPVVQPGDPYSIFQAKPDFGPSMRLLADSADWDHSSMVLTLGESGNWSDAHYGDQLQDWVSNRYRPTPFSDAAVDDDTRDTLVLTPKQP
ncbi:MAG TPA: penicillin acylase family protein [Candidatus Eremiobacteraceae bacterium]|nr:penicillin acylase family protein [Candidatus Eremiobacteraceae bacterium]